MIRAFLIASTMACISVQAQSQIVQVQRPPPEYRKTPDGAPGVVVFAGSADDVKLACGLLHLKDSTIACENGGRIWIADPCLYGGEFFADLLCH